MFPHSLIWNHGRETLGKPFVTDIMKQRDSRLPFYCTRVDITTTPVSLITVGCLKQSYLLAVLA